MQAERRESGAFFDSLRLLSLAFLPFQGRVRALYGALGEGNSLCREKQYLNLGYWGTGAQDLDGAADALAELMAVEAGLEQHDDVLDAGFGFADQDIYWMRHHGPRSITGVNIAAAQVRAARSKVEAAGLQERIHLQEGDATALPFPDGSFSVVMALESAFHFRTREKFFSEAFRVLRPGGRLVLVDLAAVERTLSAKDRVAELVGRSFWQIPRENMYPGAAFKEKLRAVGFEGARHRSIWHQVYPSFVKFARRRLQEPELAARMNPVFRRMLATSLSARQRLDPEAMDYVLVAASKPDAGK